MTLKSKSMLYLKQFPYNIIKKYKFKHKNRPIIYLFVVDDHITIISRMITYLIDDYDIVFINNLHNIKRNSIVIPLDAKAQSIFYNSSVYNIFDDKKAFYSYIKSYYMHCNDSYSNIHCINSYDSNYSGKNFHSRFIIKPVDGSGSYEILYKEGWVFDIIDKFGDKNQIQDVIQINKTYEANFICDEGNIKNILCCFTENQSFSTMRYVYGSYGKYINKIPNNILQFCKKILFDSNYSGFVEFEFIEDANGKIYIMECNARMSGHIDNPMYFKLLIEPYYNIKSSFANYIIDQYKYNTLMLTLSNIVLIQNYIQFKAVKYVNNSQIRKCCMLLYFTCILILCIIIIKLIKNIDVNTHYT